MSIPKKLSLKSEKIYGHLVGKTKEEIEIFLFNNGFRNTKNEIYVKKTDLLATTKLEFYYENNIALMITVFYGFLIFFIYESVLI